MKSRSLKSRLLAFLLVVCMVVSVTPVYAVSVGTSVTGHHIDPANASTDGYVHVDFTPNVTGHYYLVNAPEYPTLEACSDGATPASKFDFDDDEGWGYVYELTGGQTYCFKVQTANVFDVNIKQVSVAQDFDIPATLTGYAGTTISLPINFDEALSTEVACDNASVVNLCGGNAHEESLELLAPGTATITVTSHTNVVKTCTVTVNPAPVDVCIAANGVEFRVTVTGTESGWQTGSCTGSMSTFIESGKTLADVGVDVYHDAVHTQYLEGWQVIVPGIDANGNPTMMPKTDASGNEIRLTTADLLAYPLVENTVFVPQWNPSKYTSLYWMTIHGNGGTFERTTQDSAKTEVRQMGYDSYPANDPGLTLNNIGILNLTDPVCAGKEFEGWVAYYHGPTDTGFNAPVDGTLLTTAQVLTYASQGVGYTDLIAKWKNEAIDPNNCPIDGTNVLISSTPNAPAINPSNNLIISSNNGSPFTLHLADGSSETVSGWFEGYADPADGNTLADHGLTAIDLDTSTTFAYWSVYAPVRDANNDIVDWAVVTDDNGDAVVLTNANDILTYPINDGVKFEAEWDLGAGGGVPGTPGISSPGLAISGNDGSFDVVRTNPQGQIETWQDVEHTREDMDVFVGDTLADFGITDITNFEYWDGQRKFVGWHACGTYSVTVDGETYEQWGPLSDKIYTTQEILAYPAEENFIEFVAVWAGDDADYYTEVNFDAIGGEFPITEYDYTENGPVVIGTQLVESAGGCCREDDRSFSEQWGDDNYPNADPVREGYTFEGWLTISLGDYAHEMSDKLYTTEQILALPIPEDNITYLAKWKEISIDEYRFGDPYYPSESPYVQHYTLANGTELNITVTYDGGTDTFTSTYLTHHGEKTTSFEEHTLQQGGIKIDFELADTTNFEGWTTYQAEKIFSVLIPKGEDLNLPDDNYTAHYAGVETWLSEDDEPIYMDIYLVLKNAKVYSTTMTPEEVLKLTADTWYMTVAQWHEASSTLANVKAATCTAEGYTGDTVCAKCGEILKKGEAISKDAHEISPDLANVKAATCAAEGYTGDKVCVKCDTVLVKGSAIAKLAHTASPNRVNVKSATHTETGYTGDVVCANCGEILEAGTVLDIVKETVATPVVKEETKDSVDSQIKDVVAVISGENTEETKTVLSEGTKEAINEAVTAGEVVGADIVIERISEESLSGETLETFKKEVAAIEDKAADEFGGSAVVVEFIDISVIVKNRTTGEELGNITELDEPVTIDILVPAALQAENREYYIVHYHDGVAELIKGDYKDGVLTISADKFSTYALVYADVTEAPDPIVPATGDQSQLMFFTTLLLISAAGLYLVSRKLRRA